MSHVTGTQLSRSEVKVTRPLCWPPCWLVRRLQGWAWKRVGRVGCITQRNPLYNELETGHLVSAQMAGVTGRGVTVQRASSTVTPPRPARSRLQTSPVSSHQNLREVATSCYTFYLCFYFLLVWTCRLADWVVCFAGNIAKRNCGQFCISVLCFSTSKCEKCGSLKIIDKWCRLSTNASQMNRTHVSARSSFKNAFPECFNTILNFFDQKVTRILHLFTFFIFTSLASNCFMRYDTIQSCFFWAYTVFSIL